jgi:molybdopterin adenylyltransferase
VVTISDGVARGERADTSGQTIVEWANARGHIVAAQVLLSDDNTAIVSALIRLADADEADVILTTGGTGLTERDVTPEATRAVLQREASGIAEAIRVEGSAHTSYAWLSRGVAGTRSRALIINLPGSEGGVRDALVVLDRVLVHAVQLLRGVDTMKH